MSTDPSPSSRIGGVFDWAPVADQRIIWKGRNRGKTPDNWFQAAPAATDEIGQRGELETPDDADAVAEIVPEREAELGAGVHQAKERVASRGSRARRRCACRR